MTKNKPERAARKDKRVAREQERAVREQINKTIFSAEAKRRRLSQLRVMGWPGFGEIIYIIYTANLGFEIAVSVRERKQGCFRGSRE